MSAAGLSREPVILIRNGQPGDPAALSAAIGRLFQRAGEMPHHSPAMIMARLSGLENAETALVLWPAGDPRLVLTVRKRPDGSWQSMMPGAPVLLDHGQVGPATLAGVFEWVVAKLRAKFLYLPLAYPETRSGALLRQVPGIMGWERSQSSVVAWDDRGAGVLGRFRERHGSQAVRKLRTWAQLRQAELSQDAAIQALAKIEAASWKAAAASDLRSSGELGYYARLLRERAVSMWAAMLEDEPIAYQLDACLGDTVYVLEWSFDQRRAALTPGMFLMVLGLPERWREHRLAQVDLFGAPDLLKSLVATGGRARIDFAWPVGPSAAELRAERIEHDARLGRHLQGGNGLRRVYGRT